jgi:hypothetical protein
MRSFWSGSVATNDRRLTYPAPCLVHGNRPTTFGATIYPWNVATRRSGGDAAVG